MRLSLELVVIAIVILVVALVLLTIFGIGITPFGSITDFKNNCISTGRLACETVGAAPFTWGHTVNVAGQQTSCAAELGGFPCVRETKQWTGP